MKCRILFLLAVAGVLTACVKEENGTSETGKVVARFGAGLQEVKTSLGELEGSKRKIFWSAEDQIAVNGVVSLPLEEEAAGETSAVFDFEEDFAAPCNVLYPASMYKDGGTITLPSVQTYTSAGFVSGAYPMAALSQSKAGATLSPLCALIKLPLKLAGGASPDKDRISSIVFSGNAGEQICGDFSIDYANATLSPSSSAEEDKELTINVDRTLNAEPRPIVIVVPARTYASGFTVKIQDVAGHFMEMSKNVSFTVEAGHMYVMPEFEFEPTGTELGVQISSAAGLVAFAEAYNAGDYAETSPLIATLTEDIHFDAETSAAFSATGGIGCIWEGDVTNYFNGIFNGNGKTISGYTGTAPIFKYCGGGGTIQDFSIAADCAFAFAHSDDANYLGCVVGYHKGEVKNVKVAADVTVADAENPEYVIYVGGICGRITEGSVRDSEFSGRLHIGTGFAASEHKVLLGGISGAITNTAGLISQSDFKGSIVFNGTVASTDKGNPYLCIGGIVGYNSGAIENCESAEKAVENYYNETSFATIAINSGNAYNVGMGGIAGVSNGNMDKKVNASVSNCTNNASIGVFIKNTGDTADALARYLHLGGIVGYNYGPSEVNDCTNNAHLSIHSNPRHQKIGGIVGNNYGLVSSCVNSASATFEVAPSNIAPYGVRLLRLGGVVGEMNVDSKNGYSPKVFNVSNAANFSITRVENNANTDIRIGGVIGSTCVSIDGSFVGGSAETVSNEKLIFNTGNIEMNNANSDRVTTLGFHLGGVIGKVEPVESASLSIKNVSNSGKVYYVANKGPQININLGGILGSVGSISNETTAALTVEHCDNSGEVYFQAGANAAHTAINIGGILGSTFMNSGAEISNCSNAGYIHGGNSKKQTGTTCNVGGIVAVLKNYTGVVSSISDCVNTAKTYNDQFSNSTEIEAVCTDGGIVGRAQGAEGNVIEISNCTLDYAGSDACPRRGCSGGIAGLAQYASIVNCEANKDFENAAYFVGGIVGWAVNTTVQDSKYRGTSMVISQLKEAGGIVGKFDTASVIDHCYSYLATVTPGSDVIATAVYGDVAGSSVAGTVISNCHYVGNYGICSDTNFTNGGGNAADVLDL